MLRFQYPIEVDEEEEKQYLHILLKIFTLSNQFVQTNTKSLLLFFEHFLGHVTGPVLPFPTRMTSAFLSYWIRVTGKPTSPKPAKTAKIIQPNRAKMERKETVIGTYRISHECQRHTGI